MAKVDITPKLCHQCRAEDTLAVRARTANGERLYRVECWACGTLGPWHFSRDCALLVFTTPLPVAPTEPITERLFK